MFGHVINRVEKVADFGQAGRTPNQFFWEFRPTRMGQGVRELKYLQIDHEELN